jgi:outer membrane protein OmpA-like peptidoglycan-associated protein
MKMLGIHYYGALCGACLLLANAPVLAQDSDSSSQTAMTSLKHGAYIAPMGSYLLSSGNNQVGNGYGGVVAAGFRQDFFAVEGRVLYSSFPASDGGDRVSRIGGGIGGLLFPFSLSFTPKPFAADSLGSRLASDVYLIVGISGAQSKNYPSAAGEETFGLTSLSGGVGDLIPFRISRYNFAVRAEALYQTDHREQKIGPSSGTLGSFTDESAPRNFHEWVFNIGLQLPLTLTHEAASPPTPPPVEVVPVTAPADSDGDGVPDSIDQCPDTPQGVKVDEKGCPLPPPPAPCKTPAVGERISLAGCGNGDMIVLRGVNFQTNKSMLTLNAKAILDNVAGELKTYPAIQVQIAGHTDGQGSDSYNQRLSEHRADASREYLITQGISGDRMTTVGYGKSRPVAGNDTEEGRELNRRVELKIVSAGSEAAPAGSPQTPSP